MVQTAVWRRSHCLEAPRGVAPTPRPPPWDGSESGRERAPALRGCAGRIAARPGSVASVNLDFAGLSQHVDDVRLEVGVVHASLPELARVPVILPVVVPVAPTVGPEPVHVHLQGRAARSPHVGYPGGQGAGEPTVVVGEEKGAAAS